MSNNEIGNSAVYDARELGKGKMFLLGFQHMFAMFGATVLVPLLTGLDSLVDIQQYQELLVTLE